MGEETAFLLEYSEPKQNGQVKEEVREISTSFTESPDHKSYLSSASGHFVRARHDLNKWALTWQNIMVHTVPKKRICGSKRNQEKSKQILNNVSGFLESGQLLAVMGASGAGKSTLLNVLTYRNRGTLLVDGPVKINGHPVDLSCRSLIAYVQQDDLFLAELTVREHLIFQAMLRLDKEISTSEKVRRADEVIIELGLTKCKDSRIGSARFGGISGGEKKRLAFASELLTDPPIMLCDEPTTGMDSFMAENIISILKKLANKGHAVLFTIHQPSSEIFAMFDRLLLLAEGKTAFFGTAVGALTFFKNSGYSCPEDFNPADFFIYILAIKPSNEVFSKQVVQIVCEKFRNSSYAAEAETQIKNKSEISETEHTISWSKTKTSRCKSSWFEQFRLLIWRCFLSIFRHPVLMYSHLGQKVFLTLLYGLVFFQLSLNQLSIRNISGALFCLILDSSFPTVFKVLDTFYPEIPLFIRENQNGIYRTDVYYLTKVIVWIPFFTLDAILLSGIAYWMIGFSTSLSKFLLTILIMVLSCNAASSFGAFLSTSCPSLPVALAVSSPLVVMFSISGGFFANVDSIPIYMRWIEYLAWIKYSTEAINIVQWNDITNITCADIDESHCIFTGKQVLKEYSYYPDNFMYDILSLCILFIGFHLVAFLFLLRYAYRK